MGVIDLNARVTALEKNGSNSQEIDQIEADLTALEETVGAIAEDVTSDVFTPDPDLTFTTNTVKVFKIGNLCFITGTLEISGGTASQTTIVLGSIAAGYRPAATAQMWAIGNGSVSTRFTISTGGDVTSYGGTNSYGGSWNFVNGFWPIATT